MLATYFARKRSVETIFPPSRTTIRQRERRCAAVPSVPQGREKIAQRFIAGSKFATEQSPAGTEELKSFVPAGLGPSQTRIPAMNRWAIFFRPPGWKACAADNFRRVDAAGKVLLIFRAVIWSPVPPGRETIARRFIAGFKSRDRTKSRRDERTHSSIASSYSIPCFLRNTATSSLNDIFR